VPSVGKILQDDVLLIGDPITIGVDDAPDAPVGPQTEGPLAATFRIGDVHASVCTCHDPKRAAEACGEYLG
jgi:hypothetical protein